MDPNNRGEWVDKQGYWIIGIIPAVMLGMELKFLLEGISANSGSAILVSSILLAITVLWLVTNAHYVPLKIKNGKMFLAKERFPSVKRIAVPLNEIKSVTINHSMRRDEGAQWSPLEFIRVEDIRGCKYRNVIYSVSEFKEAVHQLLKSGTIKDNDSFWVKILPKGLR
jgi:hypothetical protein